MYEFALILGFAFWVGVCILYLKLPCASIFHPATYYLVFHGLCFAVRPLFQYWWDIDKIYELYLFWPTDNVKLLSLLIANLGFICFMAAVLFVGRQPFRFPTREQLALQRRPFWGAVTMLLLCAPLIAYSFSYVIGRKLQDPSEIVQAYRALGERYTQTEVAGYVFDANMMLGAFACIIAWSCRFRLWSLIPFLVFFGLRMAVGGGRFSFVMISISLVLFYLYDRHRRWVTPKFIIPAILMLFVFKSIGENRRVFIEMIYPTENSLLVQAPDEEKQQGFMYSMDFANLEYLQYLVRTVPDLTGTYNYFVDALEIFIAPIPRVLWTGKPNGSPIEFYNLFDYGRPIGMSWSLPGAGWQGLGIIGVVFWCAMGGAIWGGIYRWYVNSAQNVFHTCYYFLLLPLSVQWFRDGALLTLVKFPLFFLLPVALVQAWAISIKWGPYSHGHAARRSVQL
ncbi:oligosaccharide repeat unit polymerase [Ancylobacter pratisalsi]|uniref:Oligosaccharide repeat unit polymerase n=1 Tax=Ancylobacter pratisalsi TaxID=1745854 RepID=A0A6P1YR96_9HYPH|nr:oligosaccharide repeat unit polymerase [Ancylobacter pratisalsi]QIB34264.1 oligosaccharide repeat unit polymerase [Ancylobacter pratisalsi]